MLSKKYYEEFANIIGESLDLNNFIRKLCDYMANENPQFDRVKFIERVEKQRDKNGL